MILISVIIPTYNSREDLKACLKSLSKQTFPADKFEVIIVDDGSTDGTETEIAEARRDSSNSLERNIRYFKQKNSGPAVARNLGIKEAKGEVIAFTDSDCVADPNWLEEIDKSFRDSQTIGVSGQTISSEILIFPWRIAPVGFGFTTCNMAYRKSALEQTGGFNERFETPYYEDTDLALRLEKNGGKIIQNKLAIVTHPPKNLSFRGLARQAFFHKYDCFFSRLYPDHVDSYGAPFRPIVWGFSSVGLGLLCLSILFMGGLLLFGMKTLLLFTLLFALFFLFFLVKGYRLCISCWPGNLEKGNAVSLYDKTRTFMTLLFYVPLFLIARIISSVKYRKFLF